MRNGYMQVVDNLANLYYNLHLDHKYFQYYMNGFHLENHGKNFHNQIQTRNRSRA
jgi:hypothetical protein